MQNGGHAHEHAYVHSHGGPPPPSDAVSIESKLISNRSNRKNQNATYEGIKAIVPGFVRIGFRFEKIPGRLA